ncbi:amidohydrolase [Heyndrickxia oleronia]|uniref:amidohydrolase n=1 Tax=Heyndrickxia oleronia TaxID=38875 RepID=UPI003334B7F9
MKPGQLRYDIDEFIKNLTSQLVSWRRKFHQYPEIGWMEYVTTYYIAKELESMDYKLAIGTDALMTKQRMGIPEQKLLKESEERARRKGVPPNYMTKLAGGHTGLVAQWDTGRPGKHIALRFDIDALPIEEVYDYTHLPFKEGFQSQNQGWMHACGHDGHIAIGLGLAHMIKHFQDSLSGRFTLLFQPAEEGGRGALPMVKNGWLNDVDEFISGHIGIHSLSIGEVAATTNQFLASSKINVTYKGRAAHAGVEPEKGQNALLACATASLQLQGISRHSGGITRINIGKLDAGSGRNIIADQGRMEIETRGENDELDQYMFNEAKRMIHATGDMYGVQTKMEVVGHAIDGTCDNEWVKRVEKVASQSKCIKNVHPVLPLGASEDVTYMMKKVQNNGGKATYLIFGTPLVNGHHHQAFDFDERVLPIAVEVIGRLIIYLQDEK